MKVIPALISLCMLIWFVLPVSRGIINTGNIAGITVSGALLLIFVCFRRFSGFIKKLWGTSVGRIAVSAASLVTAMCVIGAVVISIFMIKAMNDRPKNEKTTLVVLGCQVKNGRPGNMLKRRLDAAYDYLSEHENVCVVVSGGQGADEIISEAQCMKEYLIEKGIAAERIFMEDNSTNTEENLRFSLDIIRENNLYEDITIVTDGFHQLRAELTAKKMGVDVNNISASTRLYLLPTYWVREWFGNAYYYVSQ